MDKKIILIITFAILLYLIALNYETIKTKLLNFKALLLVRNPTLPPVTTKSPPVTTTLPPVITTLPPVTTTLPPVTTTLPPVTTTLPPKKITQIKNVVGDTYTTFCLRGQPSSTIVDDDLNTIFKLDGADVNASGEKVPYSLVFTFNNIVTINSIIWHSVGNPFWDVDWVELRDDKILIQTFKIPQLDIPEDYTINLDVNSRKFFDRQIILKLNKPYIGTKITIRFKNSKMTRMTAVREIEFFT